MLDLDAFSQAVALLYDASMDVERWPDALSSVAPMFAGQKAQIIVSDTLNSATFLRTWGFDAQLMSKLMPRFFALSPSDPRTVGMTAARFRAVHCRQFVSEDVLRASDIYKEVLAEIGIEYSMLFMIPMDQGMFCSFAVMRGPQCTAFTTQDCTDFSRFVPHVGRAVTMHGTFHRYRKELATVKALLDGVPLGMMVVDDDELKVANSAARTLLSEGDALYAHGGQLRGVTRRADADLRDAVSEAQSGADRPIGLTWPIDHAEPMRAVVRRLHPSSAGMLGAANDAVALYVTDPRKPIETSEEVLQRLFGLTPREAAVLRVLAEGSTLQSAARRLHISHETVRSHLKHIMETTGARRQVDLVRMVLSSPAWLAARTAGGKPHNPPPRLNLPNK